MPTLLSNEELIRQSGEATLIASLMQSKEKRQETEEQQDKSEDRKATEEVQHFDETPKQVTPSDFVVMPRLSNDRIEEKQQIRIEPKTTIIHKSYQINDPSEVITVENSLNLGTFNRVNDDSKTRKLNKIELGEIDRSQ